MYQAIITKSLPFTNTKPTRVKATAQAGSIILSWDHGLNAEQNHALAAWALCEKYDWKGTYCGGAMPNGGYCFVCIDGQRDPTPADIGPSFKRS